jgi:trimethylamine--corrinoid protein Co-methyltransferase
MARYRTAFYDPLVADWSNFGNWSEAGGKNATLSANAIWKKRLAEFQAPIATAGVAELLDPFIARRKESGGAPPTS